MSEDAVVVVQVVVVVVHVVVVVVAVEDSIAIGIHPILDHSVSRVIVKSEQGTGVPTPLFHFFQHHTTVGLQLQFQNFEIGYDRYL